MHNSSILIKQLLNNDNNLKSISNDLFDELVDEVLLGIYFEVHRAAKSGSLFVDESLVNENSEYAIIDAKGLDIFGQLPMKKQHECICPNCHRNLAASRFAPHLEKCMGMGRNSSRIASKRIANTSVKNNDSDGDDYDNNADTDWSIYCTDSKKTRRKKDKNSNGNTIGLNSVQKKANNSKNKSNTTAKSTAINSLKVSAINGESTSNWFSSDSNNKVVLNHENTSLEKRKSFLSQMCGVVSEHTKKMCTRSKRCPQHTEEQRKHIREKFLESYVNSQNLGSNYLNDKLDKHSAINTRSHNDSSIRIDINICDDKDSNEMITDSAKSIWTEGLVDSREASPADSSSTNTSTSSVKRKNETISKSIGNRSLGKTKSRNSSKKSVHLNLNGVGNVSSSSSVSPFDPDHHII